MIEDLHREIKCAKALFRRLLCETFDLFENGLVLAIWLKSLLDLRIGTFDVQLVMVVAWI